MKRICIVVPYRDREDHLKQFIPHMKKTLATQKLEYDILVVEQENGKPFNRAKLLNIGFDFTNGEYDNYCFHDVDMLPVESDYSYCPNPTHLAARAEQFGWKLPYDGYFGGVTIFDRESFRKIDGYANEYWGWGAEDDDVFSRCKFNGVKMSRKNCSFRSLDHSREIINHEYQKNINKYRNYATSGKTNEGLRTLEYNVISDTILEDNVKKITVSI